MRALLHLDVKLPAYLPQPQNDWALVQNISPKEIKTAGGIWVPQDEIREDLALVLAVGPGLPLANGKYLPFGIKPGDIVRTTRKKGRTAYLDCMGEDGVGDSQTAYAYYQWNEIIAVEYHSELLATRLRLLKKDVSLVIPAAEELEYKEQQREKEKEKAEAWNKKEKERLAGPQVSRDFRERLFDQVFDPEVEENDCVRGED